MSNTNRTPMTGYQWQVGVGYVALPSGVDRTVYIEDCYRNARVSIWSEDSGFFNRVPIDSETLNFIVFPESVDKLGTAVVFVTEEIHNQPIVVARLQKTDEIGELRENEFKIKRKYQNGLVEISGSSNKGVLNLIVSSENQSTINIVVRDKNKKGRVIVEADGAIELRSTLVKIKSKDFIIETGVEKESETFYKQKEEVHHFSGKKAVLNEGDNPVALGNQLKKLLESLIDDISALTIVVAGTVGTLSPKDVINLQVKKKQIETILSEELFVKK